jgi:putative membrane protein
MNMMQMSNGSMMSMPMMCMIMGIGIIIFIIVLGITFYIVVRLLMKKGRTEDSPLMILRERLAKGEINEEEYLKIRNSLRKE